MNTFQSERSGNNASFLWFGLVGLVLIGLDQLIKFLVFNNHIRFDSFTKFHNYKFAFSIDFPVALIFIVYAAILAILVAYIVKEHSRFDLGQWLAWTLIFSGAISNITERILLGYVRDFLYLYGGGIVNLADFYIISGILILLLRKKDK